MTSKIKLSVCICNMVMVFALALTPRTSQAEDPLVLAQGFQPLPRPAASPLKRQDPPPPNMRPQLVSNDPAGADAIQCSLVPPEKESGQPNATPSECVVEVTDTLSIYSGYGGDIYIVRPDGTGFKYRNMDEMLIPTGSQLGEYKILVNTGDRRIIGGYTVKFSSKRIVLNLNSITDPHGSPAGSDINFSIAGYPPLSLVKLYLYRNTGHDDNGSGHTIFDYATNLSSVQTNSRGEVDFTIPTSPSDPPGLFLVVADPVQYQHQRSWVPAMFDITAAAITQLRTSPAVPAPAYDRSWALNLEGRWRLSDGRACSGGFGTLTVQDNVIRFEWRLPNGKLNVAIEHIDQVSANQVTTTVISDVGTPTPEVGNRVRYEFQPDLWMSEDLVTHERGLHRHC